MRSRDEGRRVLRYLEIGIVFLMDCFSVLLLLQFELSGVCGSNSCSDVECCCTSPSLAYSLLINRLSLSVFQLKLKSC